MKNIFKLLFSLVFIGLTTIWVLFAVETFWGTELNLSIIQNWEWFQTNVANPIQASLVTENNRMGFNMVLICGAVLLAYNAIMFLIQKVPIIGSFLKTITGFVAFFAILGIIIGALLWANVITY